MPLEATPKQNCYFFPEKSSLLFTIIDNYDKNKNKSEKHTQHLCYPAFQHLPHALVFMQKHVHIHTNAAATSSASVIHPAHLARPLDHFILTVEPLGLRPRAVQDHQVVTSLRRLLAHWELRQVHGTGTRVQKQGVGRLEHFCQCRVSARSWLLAASSSTCNLFSIHSVHVHVCWGGGGGGGMCVYVCVHVLMHTGACVLHWLDYDVFHCCSSFYVTSPSGIYIAL